MNVTLHAFLLFAAALPLAAQGELEAAPAIGEKCDRHRAKADGDRDDGDECAEFGIAETPLRLQVGKHRNDDLTIDEVEHHQNECHAEDEPGIGLGYEPAVVVRFHARSDMQVHGLFLPDGRFFHRRC